MNKIRILVISIVVCLLVGGGILMWSAYRGGYSLAKLTGGKALDKNESSDIKHITDDNFEVEVVEASKKKTNSRRFLRRLVFPLPHA